MKRSRAILFAAWCGLTLAAAGCAQIAGLTSDYRLGEAGASGAAGANGGSANGASGGAVGASGGTEPGGGTAGATGGTAGATGGGAAGATGGAGGSSSGSGGGGNGSAGTGIAGAAGGSAVGPVRIGVSEFHDSAAGNDNASSHLANATFSKPAGTAPGDFILVFFGADHFLNNLSETALASGGWTLLDQHTEYGTDGQATYLIYKFAGASEPDPIVFSNINDVPSGDGVQGLLSVYRGVNAASPINDYQFAVLPTGQTSVTQVVTATPAVTTTAANCLLIAGLSPDSAIDAPTIATWPQGFTENHESVINLANPYPDGWANIYSAERHLAAAGTVPASAFTWKMVNASEYYGSLAFVLALSP
ncbi:MAG TPA: hypothetical protein VNW92_13805 [Polyangiaceae bacterium]|jgi:hypothetical protein|nr:hypothetical protein [Polyangiaceae bacterium]